MLLRMVFGSALIVAALLTASQPAVADHHPRVWRGDIRHFEAHDLHRWRTGRWVHGRHNGYLGWWWVVAGIWYFYPSPVHPYPDPYQPPIVIQQQPPVIIQQAPPASAPAQPPTTAQTTQYWYFCEPANAYYPYVSTCPVAWKQVPATPPPPGQPPAPPPQ